MYTRQATARSRRRAHAQPPHPSEIPLSHTQRLEQQFEACLQITEDSAMQEEKLEKAEQGSAMEEEQCETPERKVGVWSQQLDAASTAKRERSPAQNSFRTPPKRPTMPTIEQLERWDRMERETNRR